MTAKIIRFPGLRIERFAVDIAKQFKKLRNKKRKKPATLR